MLTRIHYLASKKKKKLAENLHSSKKKKQQQKKLIMFSDKLMISFWHESCEMLRC